MECDDLRQAHRGTVRRYFPEGAAELYPVNLFKNLSLEKCGQGANTGPDKASLVSKLFRVFRKDCKPLLGTTKGRSMRKSISHKDNRP
jgi:hypothetical protein